MRLKLVSSLMGASLACLFASGLAAQPMQPASQGMKESLIDPDGALTTQWRWIGIREKGVQDCPETKAAGWSTRPLMVRTSTKLQILRDYLEERDVSEERKKEYADRLLLHKLGLDRFCLYTRDSGAEPFAPPDGLVKAAPDRMALAASGLNDLVSPGLTGHFRGQTLGGSPVALEAGEPRVRLTFIDSHPDNDGLPSTPPQGSQHGYTISHLAREIVCRGGRCAATFGTRRALRYNQALTSPLSISPTEDSGRVGLVTDLADAIVAEVLKWRREGHPRHLILNISLGWDGELFDDLDPHKVSRLDPSAQAVYKALRFAAHRGVLVIAAAGNRRGGPEPSTLPLLPAAWELRRPCSLPFGLGRKLVYSVGGVDWQSLPLPNFRQGGRPRRSAFGDHAVARVDNRSTAILTGSSVSASVVSSIAAVVWHLRPELHPDQVMSMIGRSGKNLEVRADFYPWRSLSFLPAPRQRRLSLCAAVQRACRPGAGRCSRLAALPACDMSEEPPPLPAADGAAIESLAWTPSPVRPERPCDSRMSLRLPAGAGAPSAPCPTDQFGSVTNQRWLFSQPDAVPCPGCAVVPDPPSPTRVTSLTPVGAPSTAPLSGESYTLQLEIAPEWRETGVLESATLDIDCFKRGSLVSRTTYPIPLEDLKTGTLTLRNLGEGQSLQGCTAQLNFVVEAGGTTMSVQNPVALNPGN